MARRLYLNRPAVSIIPPFSVSLLFSIAILGGGGGARRRRPASLPLSFLGGSFPQAATGAPAQLLPPRRPEPKQVLLLLVLLLLRRLAGAFSSSSSSASSASGPAESARAAAAAPQCGPAGLGFPPPSSPPAKRARCSVAGRPAGRLTPPSSSSSSTLRLMRGSGRPGCCALSAREALPRLGLPAERPPPAAAAFSFSTSPSGTPSASPAAALAPRPAERRAMSKVRVSNGSPTLERMEGRPAAAAAAAADGPKPSACRCLFGPVDRQELAREWQEQSRHLEEASRRRWNFDFRRGQPLDGRFEWQALDRAALPDFYSRLPRLGGARRAKADDGRERRPEINGDRRSPPRGVRSAQAPAEQEPGPETQQQQQQQQDGAALTLSSGPRKRPAAADDSSPQSKRANTTEEISEEPAEDPPMASSEEQTPKKKKTKRCQT